MLSASPGSRTKKLDSENYQVSYFTSFYRTVEVAASLP